MKPLKLPLIYLHKLVLAIFTISTASSHSSTFPKVWLSEYGQRIETDEEISQVTFPVLQSENIFNNSYLSKTDMEVVVHGSLSFIVFTCEAKYPVLWSISQVKFN